MKKMNAMLAVAQQIMGQAAQNMYGLPGQQSPNPDAGQQGGQQAAEDVDFEEVK